ncbi:hypothetical protein MNBD_GAMMA24-1398 [hydrothermal vent metagenome]|uniref:Uncharacterized protein n=1 Tax=hydrothermal vent metagenome TaxID=652676 RepID=A0A3B1B1J4_9ZZZZ
MIDNVLEQVIALIEANPRSGQALLLYALCKTLDIEKSGHMYRLGKLVDMTPANRQLSYALMELMSLGENRGEAWDAALVRMDRAIRG